MSSDAEGEPSTASTTRLMCGKLATSGQMPGFVGDEPISESFRSELVRVLQIELQAIGQKVTQETCRDIRRCMAGRGARSPSNSRKAAKQADKSPQFDPQLSTKDSFTEFYQRHRIQGAANSALEKLRESAALQTPDEPPVPPRGAKSELELLRNEGEEELGATFESPRNGIGIGATLPPPPPSVPGCIEPTSPSTKPRPLIESFSREPSKEPPVLSESPNGKVSVGLARQTSFGSGSGAGSNCADDDGRPQTCQKPRSRGQCDAGYQSSVSRQFSTRSRQRTRKAFVMQESDGGDYIQQVDDGNWRDPAYIKLRFIRFIQGDYFDYLMGACLALNAIFMGAQVQVMTETTPDTSLLDAFDIVDWCFACIFLSEVIIRIAVTGKSFFFEKWNVTDILIVALHFTELIMKAGASVENGMVDNLGMLRMLRLGRLARMVRMVRLIPELKSMVYLMTASMGSFVWAVFLMIVVMYAFAIYFTEISIDIKKANPEHAETISNIWGAIWKSMLSLYMAISGGDDWQVFLTPLTYTQTEYALLNQLIFSVYIAFSTLVMLNLVTGVFVEGAQRIIRDEQDNEVLRMASRAFLHADSDMSSEITWEEYNGILNSTQMGDYCAAVGITLNEAYDLFEILDVDKSHSLSVNEFVKGCLKLRGQCTRMDVAQFRFKVETEIDMVKCEVEDMHETLQTFIGKSASKREPRAAEGAVIDGVQSGHMEEEV